jgi:hypothetical protein
MRRLVHFSFAWPKEKRTKEKGPPAASPRLKIERFFLKRANALRFAPFERARFFTEKAPDFLHASPKRPELTHPARQLVGKTRWVFRRPDGPNTLVSIQLESSHSRIHSNTPLRLTEDPAGLPYKMDWGIGCFDELGAMRLTEDPAGLPYKMASGWSEPIQ